MCVDTTGTYSISLTHFKVHGERDPRYNFVHLLRMTDLIREGPLQFHWVYLLEHSCGTHHGEYLLDAMIAAVESAPANVPVFNPGSRTEAGEDERTIRRRT